MIRFLLVLFAVVIFVLLAAQWLIHADQVRWAYGAFAAWAASFLPFPDVAAPSVRRTKRVEVTES
jgi:hypothetical protein